MQTRQVPLWVGLVLILLLSGCSRAGSEVATARLETTGAPTLTPIVPFGLSPAVTPEPARPPTLYLEPSVLNLAVGEADTINVWIDGVQQLNSLSLEMSFNPSYLQVEDADLGAEGVQIAPGGFPALADVAHNEVTVEDDARITYRIVQEAGTGADGSGVVASITLRGVAEGGSPLLFEEVVGLDAGGETLQFLPPSSGLIAVMAGEATPTPTAVPDASPTAQPAVTAVAEPTTTAEATSTATAVPTVPPSPSLGAGRGIYYVVQPGENLYRVGLRFGSTSQAIAAASSIADPNRVQAGTMVLIPVPPPRGTYGYYVQRYDTVYSIARRFSVALEELVAVNGIAPDYHIEVGQVLIVTP